LKNRGQFISGLKPIVIASLVMILTFSPWMYKNYTFTKSTSLIKLVIGDKPRPNISLRKLERNYQKTIDESN
ncbi:MAG: hypothetical protein AAFQ02_00525, partial [Bacteroidota bacterium]